MTALRLTAKPWANVTAGRDDAGAGWVDVWCDDHEHRREAVTAAIVAARGRARRDHDTRGKTALAVLPRDITAARDAAARALRARGYSLRGRAGT